MGHEKVQFTLLIVCFVYSGNSVSVFDNKDLEDLKNADLYLGIEITNDIRNAILSCLRKDAIDIIKQKASPGLSKTIKEKTKHLWTESISKSESVLTEELTDLYNDYLKYTLP